MIFNPLGMLHLGLKVGILYTLMNHQTKVFSIIFREEDIVEIWKESLRNLNI